ncbi:Uncharacterised protein [Candidatus Gugararchaeum adminiculabundum]|nr:Uncharacterised protein [Candidatus Gugararchaeum adminiculabundum]
MASELRDYARVFLLTKESSFLKTSSIAFGFLALFVLLAYALGSILVFTAYPLFWAIHFLLNFRNTRTRQKLAMLAPLALYLLFIIALVIIIGTIAGGLYGGIGRGGRS